MEKQKVAYGLYTDGKSLIHVYSVWFSSTVQKWYVDFDNTMEDNDSTTVSQKEFLAKDLTRIDKLVIEMD